MKHDFAIHRPALYNPSLWSREEVKTYYIARRATLKRLLDDLRRERPDTKPQHRLILGQRGMGKSTLLRRIAIEVEDEADLHAQWLPLTFPEEQYNVASLADFWLNCLDALSDLLEARGEDRLAEEIDAQVEKLDRQNAEAALKALLQTAKNMKRRLLLLVDNVDLILDRLKKEDWSLREALQEHREIMLIGASSRALEASYRYDAAFYDFFKIDELRGLTLDEMRETILTLAKMRGAEDVVRKVEQDPVRLHVLHTLTGGNPRTVVLLYGVLLKGVDGNVRTDLEGLLDEVTPLYKARFEELPPLSQQVLDKLALHWDPMTARKLADALEMDINLTSSQLARLIEIGVVEKVKAGRGKRAAFQVGERFFNIWYLMRASRRVRRKLVWLVEFLRMFYSADERIHIARTQLAEVSADSRVAEYQLALARTLQQEPIGRALESNALEILFGHGAPIRLEEMLDVGGEDKDLMPRAERIKLLQESRRKLNTLLRESEVEFSIEDFIDRLLSGLAVQKKTHSLLTGIQKLKSSPSDKEAWEKFNTQLTAYWNTQSIYLGPDIAAKLQLALAHGDMSDLEDIEGSSAASERYACQLLAQLPQLMQAKEDAANPARLETLARYFIDAGNNGVLYWQSLGSAAFRDNRLEEAVYAYRQALLLNPDDADVWESLSTALATMDNHESEAKLAFAKWQELKPEAPSSWALAAIYFQIRLDDAEEAERLLQKALAIQNKSSYELSILATVLFGMSKIDLALQYCRELFESADEEFIQENFISFLHTITIALMENAGQQLLTLMDETGSGQYWRPIREALAAAVEGNAEILNGVAPEVRKPSLEILSFIAPKLLPEAPNENSMT